MMIGIDHDLQGKTLPQQAKKIFCVKVLKAF